MFVPMSKQVSIIQIVQQYTLTTTVVTRNARVFTYSCILLKLINMKKIHNIQLLRHITVLIKIVVIFILDISLENAKKDLDRPFAYGFLRLTNQDDTMIKDDMWTIYLYRVLTNILLITNVLVMHSEQIPNTQY